MLICRRDIMGLYKANSMSFHCVVSTQSQVFCATFNEVEMLHD